MAKTAPRPATYEDLLRVPEHLVAEIVEGDLYTSPRPGPPHLNAMNTLGRILARAFQDGDDGPGGWWIIIEPELHLGGDALIPDIAGWRRERMPHLPQTAAFEIAPDWVCEVLSVGTAHLDRTRKVPMYARYEIAHAWIVDPVMKTLEIYRREGRKWVAQATYGGSDVVRAEPFDVIDIDLARLWRA